MDFTPHVHTVCFLGFSFFPFLLLIKKNMYIDIFNYHNSAEKEEEKHYESKTTQLIHVSLPSSPFLFFSPSHFLVSQTQKVFSPPAFGLTFLGTGHGFDVSKSTTGSLFSLFFFFLFAFSLLLSFLLHFQGFIVWVKGRGIAVDPPIGTIEVFYFILFLLFIPFYEKNQPPFQF